MCERVQTESDIYVSLLEEFSDNKLHTDHLCPHMELRAEFDCIVEGMEQGELIETAIQALYTLLDDPPDLPPPPSPPVPAGLELNPNPQPADSEDDRCDDAVWNDVLAFLYATPDDGSHLPVPATLDLNPQPQPADSQGAEFPGSILLEDALIYFDAVPDNQPPPPVSALLELNPMQPGHLYSQGGAYGHGQCNSVPVPRIPEDTNQSLRPVGVMNGQLVYALPPGLAVNPVSAPPPDTIKSRKRKRESQQDDNDRPYVKKPPNAFMLYLKEQRSAVAAEINNRESATVNKAVAERWNSLTRPEQAKYYEQAERERLLHLQHHPGWSTFDNYGKKTKRKRKRSQAPTEAEEETQKAKQQRVTPAGMELSTSQAAAMDQHHLHVQVVQPNTWPGQTDLHHQQELQEQLPFRQTQVTMPVSPVTAAWLHSNTFTI